MDAPPKELLLAQTENYVEYSKFGRVIHGTFSVGRQHRVPEVSLQVKRRLWLDPSTKKISSLATTRFFSSAL